MNLNSGRDALRVRVTEASANFFSLLGVGSVLGRAFVAGEDKPGQSHVAVISHRLWLQAYGGDSAVIGSTAHMDGAAVVIIGVAPPRFDYPGNVDVWTPTVFDFEVIPKRGAFIWQTIGRLKSGVTMNQARQQYKAEVSRVSPDSFRRKDNSSPELVGLRDQLSAQNPSISAYPLWCRSVGSIDGMCQCRAAVAVSYSRAPSGTCVALGFGSQQITADPTTHSGGDGTHFDWLRAWDDCRIARLSDG